MFAMFLGGFEILLVLFFIPLGLLLMAFWIWMLVDAAQNRGLSQNERTAWIIAIALTHWIGAFIYLIFGRPKRHLASPA